MSDEQRNFPILPDVVVYESMHGSLLDSVTHSLIQTESVKEL
ncbi:hypothetical protein [Colwellia sp. 75C3]|nr:hypothetical protein [Colwellia sp. 75C3]